MMRPPRGCWAFISRNAAWMHKNAPVRLVSKTSRHCSKERSSNGIAGALVPALLKSRSRRPNRALISAKRAAMDAGSVKSAAIATAAGPAFRATSSSRALRRPVRTTVNPALAKAIAAASPMPLPAPVTSAIFAGGESMASGFIRVGTSTAAHEQEKEKDQAQGGRQQRHLAQSFLAGGGLDA